MYHCSLPSVWHYNVEKTLQNGVGGFISGVVVEVVVVVVVVVWSAGGGRRTDATPVPVWS